NGRQQPSAQTGPNGPLRGKIASRLGEAEALAAIDAGAQRLPPRPVVDIPAHRLAQAALERLGRPPAELRLDLGGVDGVAAIVAPPGGDGRDQPASPRGAGPGTVADVAP